MLNFSAVIFQWLTYFSKNLVTNRSLRVLLLFLSFKLLCSCTSENEDPKPNNYIIDGPEDQYPSFSPDGKLIAYYHYNVNSSDPLDYPSGLYTVNKNGENRTLILEGEYQSPSWSPSGRWLVFSASGSLYKCTIHGDSLTRFKGLDSLDYPGNYFPAWSKSGRSIVFDKALNPGYGMYRTSSEFNSVEALFDLAIVGREPELSADESFVLYTRGGGGITHTEIFKASLLDKTEIQLTKNNRDNRSATWSVDGSKIVWSTQLELYIMEADGSNQKRIGFGSDPSWSLSNEIVFSHANEDYTKEVLYITTLDGTTTQITF